VPVVVRLEGTNVDRARQVLSDARAQLPTLIAATDLASPGFVTAHQLSTTLLYAALFVPGFLSAFNISQAIAGMSEKALIVLPMVLLIIAREIDLSVASMLALTSVILGLLTRAELPLAASIPLVLASGALAGAFNGALVTRLGLPSLVVTLGTMALFRGIGYILLGPDSVNVFPDALTDFGIDNVGDSFVPWTIVPFVVLAPIFALGLQHTAIGRRIYAIGGNPDTALYSGIRLRRIRFWLGLDEGYAARKPLPGDLRTHEEA